MADLQNTSAEGTQASTDGKKFTQEEVNQIVSNRLKEERDKMKKEQDASFAEREKEITAREMRMNALEKLQKSGLPSSLVDAINCSDDETMTKSIDILMQTYKTEPQHREAGYTPKNGSPRDGVREAMGL